MRNRKKTRALRIITLAVAATLFIAGRLSQGADAQEQAKTVEQVYKNIQVLNGLAAAELDGVMNFMSASLGVGCDHCHTSPWQSDEKPAKLITRKMIEMTRRINKENFSGNNVVNCFTCHRGQTQTVTTPSFARDASPTEAKLAASKPAGALPSADEVIGKYTRAIGGEAAIEKLKTILWRGQQTSLNRMSQRQTVDVEIYQAAPNKRLVVTGRRGGTVEEGFDGTSAWAKSGRGARKLGGPDLADAKQAAEFFWFLKLKQSYPSMRVLGKENVEGRDALVVGATSKDETRERLYFDAETGLLIRRYVTLKTAFGPLPEVTDFSDYREVNGLKLPFLRTYSRPPVTTTWKFSEVNINVPIDEAKFSAPSGN